MPTPRVSIVTRTKDRPLLLRRALTSVLAQQLPDWEMLVVNDGGVRAPVDDLVSQVARAAAGRITIFHNETSRGMEAASNLALSHATGDYVVVHDDDDSWDPGFLQACVAHLDDADDGVGGVVTGCTKVVERLEEDRVIIEGTEPYGAPLQTVTLLEMARGNMFPPIAFLYRRSALDVVGGYREDLPVLGDWDFNLRFLSEYDIDVLPARLANYHLRPATTSGIYSNTVIGGVTTHQRYEARIRNALLRADLRAGRMGLGTLINVARMLNDHLWEMRRTAMLEKTLGRLRGMGVRTLAVYGAGTLCREVVSSAQRLGLDVPCVVDRNASLWGKAIEGVPVVSLADAFDLAPEAFVVASLTYAREMRETIEKAAEVRGLSVRVIALEPGA